METLVQLPEAQFAECVERVQALMSSDFTRDEFIREVDHLESVMREMPEVEQPLRHYFPKGLYGREIFNPKGSIIVTKTHGEENLSVMAHGLLGVISEDGVAVLHAPMVFVTKPGTRRIIFALEDSIFVTVHPNPENTTDLEKLEDRIILKKPDMVLSAVASKPVEELPGGEA